MSSLNDLIDSFIDLHNTGVKQRDSNWYKLMGTTIGGSEIAAIMGLSPFSSLYKIVETKIEICNGTKNWEAEESLSCWWGTLFEDVIALVVEKDLGNPVKGTNICIQKVEGHRNSPDGYVVAHLYIKDNKYHIWTTDLSPDIIETSVILLLEFKCPFTRRVTGDIPKYYKPQVLSGLAVSPIAHKGLFVDAVFRKCSVDQLGDNSEYDNTFHSNTYRGNYPVAWGSITIHIQQNKDINCVKDIYENCFGIDYLANEANDIIDLGDVPYNIFHGVMSLVNNGTLLTTPSTVKFADGRGSTEVLDLRQRNSCYIFAVLPWKLFDITYVPVEREPNFLENIYPLIQKVHRLVLEGLNDSQICEKIRITDICDNIYT